MSPTGTARTSTPCRKKAESNGIKVAVVGSGPSGLTCASLLAKKGYAVSLFEALHTAGGVLVYGIPEFRLPKAIVANEVEKLKAQGVEVMTDMVIGKVLSIDELFEMGFKAVFIGSGAGLPMFMHIPGESLKGVCSANEYLTRINLMKAYLEESDTPILHSKAAAIVGGGNVAMDAARCAKRMGTDKVYIVYRRGEAEMPARLEEQHHAKEEGIEFLTLTNPTEILGGEDGRVCGMKCIKMELGEPDASGRRRPIPIEGSEFVLDVDMAIMSLGTSPNPLIRSTTPGLETNKKGGIIVDEKNRLPDKATFPRGGARPPRRSDHHSGHGRRQEGCGSHRPQAAGQISCLTVGSPGYNLHKRRSSGSVCCRSFSNDGGSYEGQGLYVQKCRQRRCTGAGFRCSAAHEPV